MTRRYAKFATGYVPLLNYFGFLQEIDVGQSGTLLWSCQIKAPHGTETATMKCMLFASVALLAFSMTSHAQAADLPPEPAYKAPAAAVPPMYNWTGFYIGMNGGYGWGAQDPLSLITDRFDRFSFDISGGMFGGTLGAQLQVAHVVMGLESDIDWASIKGSGITTPAVLGAPLINHPVSLSTNITSVSTVRTRVGYAADNWLFFVSGGVALLGGSTTLATIDGTPICGVAGLSPSCSGSGFRFGAAAGAGIEYGFAPNWSAKVEYLYVAGGTTETAKLNTLRAGINYRFGGN